MRPVAVISSELKTKLARVDCKLNSGSKTMKNLHKWMMLAPLLLVALLPLKACQSTSPNTSSVIEEVANETEASVCADLEPEKITRAQFDNAPQWARDHILRAAAAWKARCDA